MHTRTRCPVSVFNLSPLNSSPTRGQMSSFHVPWSGRSPTFVRIPARASPVYSHPCCHSNAGASRRWQLYIEGGLDRAHATISPLSPKSCHGHEVAGHEWICVGSVLGHTEAHLFFFLCWCARARGCRGMLARGGSGSVRMIPVRNHGLSKPT